MFGFPQRQLQRLVEGESVCMPRAEQVRKADVRHTLQWICEKFNAAASMEADKRTEHNMALAADFCSGKMTAEQMTAEQLAGQWKEKSTILKIKDYKHLARKFLKKNGYTKQATNTSGNYLAYDDEKMIELLS